MRFVAVASAALIAAFALGACTRPGGSGPAASSSPSTIAFVRMDELVKSHPLYGQLASYDRNIEALNFGQIAPEVPKSGAELAQADAELDRELREAGQRTNALLKEKQAEYIKRETAAINAAVGNAGAARGPSGATIANGVQNVASQQQSAALNQVQKDMQAYQATLIKQDQEQEAAAIKTINDRAAREYRAKADDLQAKESAFSLQLASADAAERLTLRTKVSNLALEDSDRDAVRAQLAALDRKEADQVAAMRNRDQQTLSQYNAQLHDQSRAELAKQVAAIRADTSAKLHQRSDIARAQLGTGQQQTVTLGATGATGPAVPADLKPKIEALHKQYTDAFKRDAQATILSYNKTRADLQKRYNQLHGVDFDAQARVQREILGLQKQRDALYDQMVAQITDQVKALAESRGYAVVFSNIIAPAGSVDLTPDAEKEIESLHE